MTAPAGTAEGSHRPTRHILSLSGGKDSAALAVYMRDRIPDIEYLFCDTGKELPETYEYLRLLEVALGRPIIRLRHEDRCGFDELLAIRGGYLPSPQVRWCTQYLKIRPFEQYVGTDAVINYIGIRADESDRKRYISSKPNIQARYPFVDDGIGLPDVIRILEKTLVAGKPLGLPEYYRWRSRSGCYFCFFQQRREWVGLLENHPELFQEALAYEKPDLGMDKRYTWVQGESLIELSRPERVARVKQDYEDRLRNVRRLQPDSPLKRVFEDCDDASNGPNPCLICYL